MRFLFVDRIVELKPGKLIRGIKHVTSADDFLYTTTNGCRYFASSLIGEALGQLAAWNVMLVKQFTYRPVAGVVASAKLFRPAFVGETIWLESYIDCLDEQAVQYHSAAYVNNQQIFAVEGALGPLLPMSDFVSEQEVRQQFKEINRPGAWPVCPTDDIMPVLENFSSNAVIPLHLQFDKIIASEPGISITAEKKISKSMSYLADHFPYHPVLPMTVLLECKMNLAYQFLQGSPYQHYQIKELSRIKMNDFVRLGDTLTCFAVVHQHNEYELILRFRSEVEGKRVCVLDMILQTDKKVNG